MLESMLSMLIMFSGYLLISHRLVRLAGYARLQVG